MSGERDNEVHHIAGRGHALLHISSCTTLEPNGQFALFYPSRRGQAIPVELGTTHDGTEAEAGTFARYSSFTAQTSTTWMDTPLSGLSLLSGQDLLRWSRTVNALCWSRGETIPGTFMCTSLS